MEPMASIVLVVLVLGTPLTLLDIIGMVCIIATVLLLSVQKK
jgi:drug/metabolite transporter (DMT)-like permease